MIHWSCENYAADETNRKSRSQQETSAFFVRFDHLIMILIMKYFIKYQVWGGERGNRLAEQMLPLKRHFLAVVVQSNTEGPHLKSWQTDETNLELHKQKS